MIKLFITGTGTDVGKTFVSAGLSWHICHNNSKSFTYIKPVASGVGESNSDVEFVQSKISEFSFAKAEGWYAYKEPASPFIAAKAEQKTIPYQELLTRIKDKKPKDENFLVEGAGGVLVPITNNKLVIDLMEEIKWPILVVGHAGLGTVNHTCLTIEALKNRNCQIVGVVLNQTSKVVCNEFELATATNKAEIERITGIPVLGVIPFQEPSNGANFAVIVNAIAEYFAKSI